MPESICTLALLFLLGAFAVEAGPRREVAMPPSEGVILLHGLGRSRLSMARLARALEGSGYRVVNPTYPSRRKPIEELAPEVIAPALVRCRAAGCSRIHFVTHSMGGILLRQFLSVEEIPELGRAVMLGPPHGGSEIVDRLGDRWWFRALLGPAAVQLGTGPESAPRKLGPARFSLGVIAGTRSWDPIGSSLLPGPGDGKVTVENTRIEGMSDHLVLGVSHVFMPFSGAVCRQVKIFLAQGRFDRSAR